MSLEAIILLYSPSNMIKSIYFYLIFLTSFVLFLTESQDRREFKKKGFGMQHLCLLAVQFTHSL